MSIVDEDIVLISNSYTDMTLDAKMLDTVVPREFVYLYTRDKIIGGDSSQKILHQFNLDFDRQVLAIQNKKCKTRCSFFREVTKNITRQNEMDLLLLLCQQTVLGTVLQSVQTTLLAHGIYYLILDNKKATTVLINCTGLDDFSVKVKKQMYLVDPRDPGVIVNIFDICIYLDSLKNSKDIQANVTFHWRI